MHKYLAPCFSASGAAAHRRAGPVLCFGDSNTYGFDPREPLGGRYPEEVRWTGRLASAGWPIRAAGENGREIPRRIWELEELARLADGAGAAVVMLGSNDLLQTPGFTAGDTAARMERCLNFLRQRYPALPVLLTVPPPMAPGAWVAEERLLRESARLAGRYRELAEQLGILFADAGAWGVELLFDGVHFSNAGHAAFAAGMLGELPRLAAAR